MPLPAPGWLPPWGADDRLLVALSRVQEGVIHVRGGATSLTEERPGPAICAPVDNLADLRT